MASDSFTGATDGVDLPTYSSSWVTPSSGTPMKIQVLFGDPSVTLNNSSGMCCNYYNSAVNDKHYSKAVYKVQPIVGFIGVAIRIQPDASSFFYANPADDGNIYIGECIDGTPVDWGSRTAPPIGTTIELAVDAATATTIRYKENGVVVETFTGKNALSGGYAGLNGGFGTGTGNLDNWEGGDVIALSASALPLRAQHPMMLINF